MKPSISELQQHKLNPRKISDEAVQNVTARLDAPASSLFHLLNNLKEPLSKEDFSDIFIEAFQLMRMGDLGWRLPIDKGDIEKYKLSEAVISSLGTDDLDKDKEPESYGALLGGSLMRVFVASAFAEEAKIKKLPPVSLTPNDKLIDAISIDSEDLNGVRASEKGCYMFDKDALETKWQKENPSFYQATLDLSKALAEIFTPDILKMYGDLPQEFLDKIEPKVNDHWQNYLMEHALRTYAWFTPNPPKLIPVPVKN